MQFPIHGHTRTRGMFRTLDTPGDVRLEPTQFAPQAPVVPYTRAGTVDAAPRKRWFPHK